MFRFFALAWDPTNRAQSDAAQALSNRLHASPVWDCTWRQNGIAVYCSGSRPTSPRMYVLQRGAGAIVGTVFERKTDPLDDTAAREATLGERESSEIIRSAGRRLIESYWGCYVAFLTDPSRASSWVLSSPVSPFPCFHTTFRGASVFFSRAEDCVALGIPPFSFDWRYVAASVFATGRLSGTTAFAEVSDIKPGECMELCRGRLARQFYWNPCAIAGFDPIQDPAQAVELARAATKSCIRSWASRHERIVHKLSGGLDSSVVIGSLNDPSVTSSITCVNQHSRGSNGDERLFARLAAKSAECELIEIERDPLIGLRGMLDAARTVFPHAYHLDFLLNQPIVQIARERKATGLFSGNLGDVLFYLAPVAPAATDYLCLRGLRPGLLKVAIDVALIGRTSIWDILRDAWRDRKIGVHDAADFYGTIVGGLTERRRTLANPDVVRSFSNNGGYDPHLIHPWFREARGVPPGKLWQIFEMTGDYYEHPLDRPDDPDTIEPFYSQPLAELCLRIPTYVHLDGGWDRAIVRRAMKGSMPDEILTRATKGGMEEYGKEILQRNIGFVREILLNGALVRERLLDRGKLEAVLSGLPVKTAAHPQEVLTYVCIEAWLNSWAPTQQHAAA